MALGFIWLAFSIIICHIATTCAFPEQTKWTDVEFNIKNKAEPVTAYYQAVLFNKTDVRLQIQCSSENSNAKLAVRWYLRYSDCSRIFPQLSGEDAKRMLNETQTVFNVESGATFIGSGIDPTKVGKGQISANPEIISCDDVPTTVLKDLSSARHYSVLAAVDQSDSSNKDAVVVDAVTAPVPIPAAQAPGATPSEKDETRPKRDTEATARSLEHPNQNNRIMTSWCAGPYLLVFEIASAGDSDKPVSGRYTVQFAGPHGYLSLLDYPLLMFYTAMCVLYGIYCVIWIVFSALHWKDLLRVQFCIGAVIGLGLLEKAVLLWEYEHLNMTGSLVKSAEMTAELISVLKRTLARVLVLVVSLGYGIIKPRLGSIMNNVVAIGLSFFVFASIESGLRVYHRRNELATRSLIADIPLAVTDAIICWWVFSALMMTLKNLKLRRNIVKLTLYRHFFNTLIFALIASVVYMAWSIKMHKLPDCVTDWKELWIDDAYWQLLFFIILGVIIFLWRPSQNNKRFAFSPLMDNEDEEQEDPMLENENFEEVKYRRNLNLADKNKV